MHITKKTGLLLHVIPFFHVLCQNNSQSFKWLRLIKYCLICGASWETACCNISSASLDVENVQRQSLFLPLKAALHIILKSCYILENKAFPWLVLFNRGYVWSPSAACLCLSHQTSQTSHVEWSLWGLPDTVSHFFFLFFYVAYTTVFKKTGCFRWTLSSPYVLLFNRRAFRQLFIWSLSSVSYSVLVSFLYRSDFFTHLKWH